MHLVCKILYALKLYAMENIDIKIVIAIVIGVFAVMAAFFGFAKSFIDLVKTIIDTFYKKK